MKDFADSDGLAGEKMWDFHDRSLEALKEIAASYQLRADRGALLDATVQISNLLGQIVIYKANMYQELEKQDIMNILNEVLADRIDRNHDLEGDEKKVMGEFINECKTKFTSVFNTVKRISRQESNDRTP